MNLIRRRHPLALLASVCTFLSAATVSAHVPEVLSRAIALEQQSQVWEAASQLMDSRPEWAAQVQRSLPSRSRTGSLVFGLSQIADPAAATLLIARAGRHPDPAFRRAVAEALPETQNPNLGALIATELALESDAQVRVSLAHALRYAQDDAALTALRSAAQDSDPQVRETALASIRLHPQFTQMASTIVAAIEDEDPRVQAAALRAWGSLRDPELEIDIEKWLRADSAGVRLAALRGQWRVDRAVARRWARRLELDQDSAPRVARLAQRVLSAD